MDVIYLLMEDKVFSNYMEGLFHSAEKFVIIYSSNCDRKYKSPHQVDRHFTPYVSEKFPEWELIETLENPYRAESVSDFFVYAKKDHRTQGGRCNAWNSLPVQSEGLIRLILT